jgi:glutathione S-transferase
MRHDGLEISESQAIGRYLGAIGSGPVRVPADRMAAARVTCAASRGATSIDKILLRRYVMSYAFRRDHDGNAICMAIDQAIKRFACVFFL